MNPLRRRGAALPLLVLLDATPAVPPAHSQGSALTETVILELPPGDEVEHRRQLPGLALVHPEWWTFWGSTAGHRVAVPVRRSGRWWLLGSGSLLGPYDEIDYATFSPDGSRLAVLVKAGTWHVVTDGAPGPGFDEIRQVGWSPDGRRLAYAGRRGGRWRLVEDGVEKGDHEEIAWLRFSPDGSQLLYAARRGGRWGLEGAGVGRSDWDQIWNPTFSPDGSRVAYGGRRGGEWRVMLDGREGPPFANLSGGVFSPDGSRFAYLGSPARVDNPPRVERFRGGESTDLLRKRQYPERTFLLDDPGRSRVAWWVVMTDSIHGSPAASTAGPLFDTSGVHMVYLAGDEALMGVYRDGRKLLDLGSPEPGLRPGEPEVPGPILVRTFVTNSDATRLMVVYDSRGRRRSVLPGAGPVAYSRAVIVDLDSLRVREGPFHRRAATSGMALSPDGQHWGYEVLEDEGGFRWRVVLDLQPGPIYDQILMNSLTFTADSAVYLARQGRRFLRVSHALNQ